MQVSALNVHPVKSTAIRPLTRAYLEPWGFRDDRHWMVVDRDGEAVTARTEPRLFTITARTRGLDGIDADLELSSPGAEAVLVSRPTDGATAEITLFKNILRAVDVGADAQSFVRDILQREDVSLVWCPDPRARRLNPDFARPGDSTAFADGYPVLLTTTASLAQLNTWIAADAAVAPPRQRAVSGDPLPMQRFRPNLVIDGSEPFAEDHWHRIQVGETVLRLVKPCDRCVMTTIDPTNLSYGHQPLYTLARHRRVGSKALFGHNLIPERPGWIAVGDPVVVLDDAD